MSLRTKDVDHHSGLRPLEREAWIRKQSAKKWQTQPKDFTDLYKKIAGDEWFKKAYHNKEL
jgi:hypothetical protein